LNTRRVSLGIAVALHAFALAALLSYAPARKALLRAPIMVDFILLPKAEKSEPEPPTELPRPLPVAKRIERPVAPPALLAAPAHAPSPQVAPPPSPEPPVPLTVVSPPAPPAPAVETTQPIFNADYLDNPAPPYPSLARRNGEQGRVLLRVLVNARGTADEVQVRASSGHSRLDDAARDTVRRWKFVPAKRGAEPVPAWVLIPVSFRLEG
jgi:protein TonB